MEIEELTKQQLILLALLVSFITSIATGIVTVSLMDQAPQSVTQVIDRVVERTVERVMPNDDESTSSTTENSVLIETRTVVTDSTPGLSEGVQLVRSSFVCIESRVPGTEICTGEGVATDIGVVSVDTVTSPSHVTQGNTESAVEGQVKQGAVTIYGISDSDLTFLTVKDEVEIGEIVFGYASRRMYPGYVTSITENGFLVEFIGIAPSISTLLFSSEGSLIGIYAGEGRVEKIEIPQEE